MAAEPGSDFPAEGSDPYVGARPFTDADRVFFFGRENEASELASLIAVNSIVILHAQSGAGKSSLLAAGVMPKLLKKGYVCLGTARVGTPNEAAVEATANIYLTTALRSIGCDPKGAVTLSAAIGAIINRQPAGAASSKQRFVLMIDQFEELFISAAAHWKERVPFLVSLAETARNHPRLTVVLSLREEYLADLDPLYRVCLELPVRRYQLHKLDRPAAIKAITFPARQKGVSFEKTALDLLLTRLFRLPIDAPSSDALSQFAEPVQLQVVCQSIWSSRKANTIDLKTVEKFGEVERALGLYYERTIDSVAKATGVSESRIRGWIERYLITPVRTRGLVLREQKQTKGLPNEVLQALAGQYLLHGMERGKDLWYELAHDRLAGPILDSNACWQERKGLAERWKGLSAQAQIWREGGKKRQLLHGASLRAAQAFLQRSEVTEFGLSEQIVEYVRESADATAARRMRSILLAIVGVGVISFFLVWWVNYQGTLQMQREREDRTAEFERMAEMLGKHDESTPQALAYALLAGARSQSGNDLQQSAARAALQDSLQRYGHALRLRPLGAEAGKVIFDDREQLAAVVSQSTGGATVWDIASGKKLLEVQGSVQGAQFSADSRRIAFASREMQPGHAASSGRDDERRYTIHVGVHNVREPHAPKELVDLRCEVLESEQLPCFALSRDFARGAVRKDQNVVDIADFALPAVPVGRFKWGAGESASRIRSLVWARNAPVLMVTADARIAGKDTAEVIAIGVVHKGIKIVTRQAKIASGSGFGYGDSGPQLWSSISPDGKAIATATSAPSGRFKFALEHFSTATGQPLSPRRVKFLGSNPLLSWSSDGGTLIVVSGLNTWLWPSDSAELTEIAAPPFDTMLSYDMNSKGEIGGLTCMDERSSQNRFVQPCARYGVVTWHYGSSPAAAREIPEFSPGKRPWPSDSFGVWAAGSGSGSEAYVKIYRTGERWASAEDNNRADLHQLIRQACSRLANSSELTWANSQDAHCFVPGATVAAK